MKYFRFEFKLPEDYKEVLLAELGELPFEAFDDARPDQLIAWIQQSAYVAEEVLAITEQYAWCIQEVKGPLVEEEQNWNAVWESNYEPVEIDDFVRIRAPFHASKSGFVFELEIEPKMSFGTGHHGTTAGVIRLMRGLELRGKRVLDMGSGTGVLGILAAKLGAGEVHAIDIEDWAVENAIENAVRNEVLMQVDLGDAAKMHGMYEVILANINRNILVRDMSAYAAHAPSGAVLICSGFYKSDVDIIRESAALNSFILEREYVDDPWASLLFVKK